MSAPSRIWFPAVTEMPPRVRRTVLEPGCDAHVPFAGRSQRSLWETGFKRMIDLNVATAEELDAIPALKGHGFEIVRYREERGRFTSLRQLDEVPGLAGKTDDLGEDLTVGND